jgi:hypothetical protein
MDISTDFCLNPFLRARSPQVIAGNLQSGRLFVPGGRAAGTGAHGFLHGTRGDTRYAGYGNLVGRHSWYSGASGEDQRRFFERADHRLASAGACHLFGGRRDQREGIRCLRMTILPCDFFASSRPRSGETQAAASPSCFRRQASEHSPPRH